MLGAGGKGHHLHQEERMWDGDTAGVTQTAVGAVCSCSWLQWGAVASVCVSAPYIVRGLQCDVLIHAMKLFTWACN